VPAWFTPRRVAFFFLLSNCVKRQLPFLQTPWTRSFGPTASLIVWKNYWSCHRIGMAMVAKLFLNLLLRQ